ncbi:MAG: hypothetical protein ABSA83_09290 [Verrucomicrobiota bacterium]|jgi:hypothetical protein
MKRLLSSIAAGLLALGTGCASRPVVVAPVGPNPNGIQSQASTGSLQVFSRMAARDDDQNMAGDGIPIWHQYTEYRIYQPDGKLVKTVINSVGHYSDRAEVVALPPGSYMVKAQAKDYFWVNVPVRIEPGRTTRVHLDQKWRPPGNAPKNEIVTGPDGNPLGWRAPAP